VSVAAASPVSSYFALDAREQSRRVVVEERQREVYERQAAACRSGDRASLYGELCERLASEHLVHEVAPDYEWNLPLRLFAALHYLALDGRAPELARAYSGEGEVWPAFRAALERESEWVARFLREQGMQTNEVQRCYGLLPAFLLAAAETGRELDLIELGPSAGFNLLWDRYSYRYGAERWGKADAPIELSGELRAPLPSGLLAIRPVVRKRLGIDLSPIDVNSEHGARLLRSFIWPDQVERLQRLEQAIEVVRADSPRILRGDYLELLEPLLDERSEEALTVVFQTASLNHLPSEARLGVEDVLIHAGERGPLAFISGEHTLDDALGYWQLRFRLWPGGGQRILARFDPHGRWLEWLGKA
jgi:hypothetical protein